MTGFPPNILVVRKSEVVENDDGTNSFTIIFEYNQALIHLKAVMADDCNPAAREAARKFLASLDKPA